MHHALDMESVAKKNSVKPTSISFLSEDDALAYLAKILVDAYFEQKKYGQTKATR